MLHVDYPEKDATTMANYYTTLLAKLRQQLASKHQSRLSKEILFPQDNAAPHMGAIMHQKLADLHFETPSLLTLFGLFGLPSLS
jgi:hypothetical protein